MSEFIVLGLIPGTQMQISFAVWLLIAIGLSMYMLGRVSYRTQVLHGWLIATTIMLSVQRQNVRS